MFNIPQKNPRKFEDKESPTVNNAKSLVRSDWCQRILSILYGQILLVLGLVLPLISLTANIDKSVSELFYIYLLLGSILYLIFVQIDLMYLK